MADPRASDIVEQISPHSFADTLQRLLQSIEKAGMAVFATIDHAANARTVGMSMPPTTVLIYGNPKGGTPIMLATPAASLDLPLHVLVREGSDGKVIVAFHPVIHLLRRAGVPEEAAARLEPAQRLLAAALAP